MPLNKKIAVALKANGNTHHVKQRHHKVTSIPVIFETAGVLAALTSPNHIVIYAHGDSFACRLPAPSSILGISNETINNNLLLQQVMAPA